VTELEELSEKIQVLRKSLAVLIDKKDSLFDPDVVALSNSLDDLLNEHERLIKQKKNREP